MAALLFGIAPVVAYAATPQLVCTPTRLGFGAIVVGQSETFLVTLANTGQSSVTVSGISVSNSEFTTSQLTLPLVLAAGESVDLSVVFTPTKMGWTGGPIKFSSDATNPILGLDAGGIGVASEGVTASPSTVAFSQVRVGTKSTLPVVFTNARSWKITLPAPETSGGAFSMTGPSFPLTLDAGQSVTVNVAFAPQSAGTVGGRLFVPGPALAIPLTGTGTAPGQLTANLGNLNFANVPVGSSQTQSVILTNSGGSGLTVSHATLTGTGFTLSGLALPPTLGAGQSATLSVVFAPQSAGSASGNLAFASNASNPAMNLPLSGNTPLVAITVNPNSATLVVGSTQQFTANVTGTSETAVAWTVSGADCIGVACGTISPDGLYVSPSSVPSPATVTVKATSVVDFTKSASANVAIVGAVAVLLTITPTSASVPTAGSQLFTASVTGTSNTAVTWSLSGAGCSGSSCGTLSTSSLSAGYLAPSVAPTPANINVIATSVVDPTKSASANLIIVPAVVVGVTPANVSITSGTTQQFAASVTGTSNTAVNWTVSGVACSRTACGTINSSGLYTAPFAAPSPDRVTATATSVADSTKSASVVVTIVPTQAAGYNLVWEDTFSTLSLCTASVPGCNWYTFELAPGAPAGVITDPSGTYVNLEWSDGQGNWTNISTSSSSGVYANAWTFGYFEVSMKFDPTTGSWPALWMLPIPLIQAGTPETGGEIDFFEWQSHTSTTGYGTVHVLVNNVDTANNRSSNAWAEPGGTNFANYNTYAVLWTPTAISWYFNNSLVETFSTTGAPFNTVFGGSEPYALILSQQPGCNWTTCSEQLSPLNMQVQWVRVYQAPAAYHLNNAHTIAFSAAAD
jgi:beta-glucanase (GH16 family)